MRPSKTELDDYFRSSQEAGSCGLVPAQPAWRPLALLKITGARLGGCGSGDKRIKSSRLSWLRKT